MALMELMLLIRCASIALATNLDSSEDHTFMVVILDFGTQAAYTSARVAAARLPEAVAAEPIMTQSGLRRSFTAVPSARNSGFERISNLTPGLWISSYFVLVEVELIITR